MSCSRLLLRSVAAAGRGMQQIPDADRPFAIRAPRPLPLQHTTGTIREKGITILHRLGG